MRIAIRALMTGLIGLLVAVGLIPESMESAIVEHATTVVGSVLVIWSLFAAGRAKKEAATMLEPEKNDE